jgi:glycosyltransferase involved in cell wall biosynthesis
MSIDSSISNWDASQLTDRHTPPREDARRTKGRLLFVSVNTFYGGGETHVENVARMIKDSCSMYAIVFDGTLVRNLRMQGVQVHQLSLFPRWARILQVLHAMAVLPFMILRYDVQAVQVTGTVESLLLVVSRLFGCSTVSIRHLVPFVGEGAWHTKLRRLLIEAIYSAAILSANRVICVSEAVGREMRKLTSKGRIVVIPNWVPVVPARKSLRTQGSPLRLLFVGRLERHKGLHLLLEALQGLSGYELGVVGDGSERTSLELLAKGMNVHFYGFHSDPSEYYRTADIFIMPSLGPEGLPLVTIEAMSYGLPCILSDLPVHQELSANGAAMLFTSANSRDLKRRLEAVLTNPVAFTRYGDAAYERVLQRHSPEVARAAYLDAFGFAAQEVS